MDQAEGLCHRITLHFGRLNIETGVLYYCTLIRLKYWTVVCFVKVWWPEKFVLSLVWSKYDFFGKKMGPK